MTKKDLEKVQKKHKMDTDKIVIIVFVTFLIAIFSVLIALLIFSKQKEFEVETREIKSIDNESDTFTIGINHSSLGVLSSRYYFNMKSNNGFKLVELFVSNVEIVEIENGTPYIEGHFNEHGDVYEVGIDMLLNYSSEEIVKLTEYTLYLPKGYTIKEYKD